MSQKSEQRFRAFASIVLSGVSKLLFGTRRHVEELPQKGSLILCNHTSIWDFSYLCYGLRPVSNVHFVATGIQFDKSRFWGWLFKNLGIIRKTQGAVDVMCVKEIIKAVRAGDNVALYAAGMTSYDGRPGWSAMSGTGSLAKLLKCPVYAAVTEGGYISRPRYTTHMFRGHTDITIKRICTGENMSVDDYQKEIDEALYFNDWDWQENNHIPFRRIKGDLKGLERTLYMCPSCRALGFMKTSKHEIACSKCGFSARRDKYGFFVSDNAACPKRLDKWADMELDEVRSVIESGKLYFEEPALYRCGDTSDKGTLRMTPEGISFETKTGTLSWGHKDFQFIILNDDRTLLFHIGNARHSFDFDNPALLYRWFYAHRCLVNPEFLR